MNIKMIFTILLLCSITATYSSDFSTNDISKKTSTKKSRRRGAARHGTGSRTKTAAEGNDTSMYYDGMDKFAAQDELSASRSPRGTTEGESN